MRRLFFLFSILVSMRAFAGSGLPSNSLSIEDQKIFEETVGRCQAGSVTSAIHLGFSSRNFVQGLANWLEISSLSLQASAARAAHQGLSANVHSLRSSPGFWLALTQCYGYREGELNYGNLMKQIIDFGHLSTEVASTSVGIGVAGLGIKSTHIFMQKFPILGRFITSALLAGRLAAVVEAARSLVFTTPTVKERQEFQQLEAQIFLQPDQAVTAVKDLAERRLSEIEDNLKSATLSEAERASLIFKREKLAQSLRELNRLSNGYSPV